MSGYLHRVARMIGQASSTTARHLDHWVNAGTLRRQWPKGGSHPLAVRVPEWVVANLTGRPDAIVSELDRLAATLDAADELTCAALLDHYGPLAAAGDPAGVAAVARVRACQRRLAGDRPVRIDDPFPLLEEAGDPSELPTVDEWLAAGAPMREVTP